MVPVGVSIVARGAGAGAGGGFGIGQALHDAGRVLTIAAGVLLIALAVFGPLAILATLTMLFIVGGAAAITDDFNDEDDTARHVEILRFIRTYTG